MELCAPVSSPISIHALHEESDPSKLYHVTGEIFQSTLSMRRATPKRRNIII